VFLISLTLCGESADEKVAGWTYSSIDKTRTQNDILTYGWERWFGMGIGDATGDGLPDIVSGKWFYRNPGGDLLSPWPRSELGHAMDGVFVLDVDGDAFGDVIALRCNEQYWLEAEDAEGTTWRSTRIGTLPICNHGISAQGYTMARLFGKLQYLVVSNHENSLFAIEVPLHPEETPWPSVVVTPDGATEKGMVASDVDGDGDLDLFTACSVPSRPVQDRQTRVCWFENPGVFKDGWLRHEIGDLEHKGDRFAAGDINGDGREDLVVSEGRWPGEEPDASLFWFERPPELKQGHWTRHTVATGYSMNSLSLGDLDQDGDTDIVVGEHKGPDKKLLLFSNQGDGGFVSQLIDTGKENHLGARLTDFDGDGDLDITGFGWDTFQYIHLWRNDNPLRLHP